MPVPVFNTSYSFYVSLADAADPSKFKASPTIAAGDFQISIDGSAFVNLTTTPVVVPVGGIAVLVPLTADEMNGKKVNIQAIDASGSEWEELLVSIDVPTASTETINDIQEGDRIESNVSLVINKKGTTIPVLDKAITGSLLSPSASIQTKEAP